MYNFIKYSASGNDFVIFDNRKNNLDTKDVGFWERICHRKFGVGADGVLFVELSDKYDFHMRYLNADGNEESMCGNGSRAISHFYYNQISNTKTRLKFSTKNSVYESEVKDQNILVNMTEYYDVQKIKTDDLISEIEILKSYYSNTGVEHTIFLVEDVESADVYNIGKKIRYNPIFKFGTNVNFISKVNNGYKIRTYERGVEDETLACGTGITAAARFLWDCNIENSDEIKVFARGGNLIVRREHGKIYFGGIVTPVFEGKLC